MNDERLAELFAQALSLDERGQQKLLGQLAAGPPEESALGRELGRLLASSGLASPLLDRPPAWIALAANTDTDPMTAMETPMPARIGAYRIVSELGRGGMGRVFLAEEETADFRRTVALKIIDSPAADAVRRFRDEVRILSSLEHPGIARFIHGGRAPDGVWFIALEYIQGEDLLRFSRTQGLSTAGRIELFLSVLEAVDYAHQRGVVHRDLKPGHLLVGADGRPRLLDFGISKLLDPETRESLAVTRTESRALTPAYASPEQFRGDPVTPSSDIYSLGVVLYELLADRRPFAGTDESRADLERAVLETDPEPPSHAARRGSPEPLLPGRQLPRDLDAICLKALRKEPAERFASAAEFAADLRRVLAGRPVEARRGGLRYRLARFVSREKGRLAVGAALAVALLAVAFALSRDHRSASLPHASPGPAISAAQPATGIEPVRDLAARFAAAPESLDAGAALANALVRDARVKEAEVVIGRLRQLPGATDDPLVDHTEALVAMNQNESQRVLALETRALANAAARGRANLIPAIRGSRAFALSSLGQPDEAHSELLRALREAQDLGDRATEAIVLNDLAVDELMHGDLDAGERLLQQALVPARALADTTRLGYVLDNLAGISLQRGRPDLAAESYRAAIDAFRKIGRKRRAAISTGALSEALRDLGEGKEAAALRDSALVDLRTLDDASLIADVLFYRAIAALDAGEIAGVENDAAAIEATAITGGDRKALALAETVRGRAAALAGDVTVARRRLSEATRLHVADGDLDLASEIEVLQAAEEKAAGDSEGAHRSLVAALARLDGAAGTTTALLAEALEARIAVATGHLTAARAQLALIADSTATSPSLNRRLAFLEARAALAAAEGRIDAARDDLVQAIAAAEAGSLEVRSLELRLALAATETRQAGDLRRREVEAEADRLGLRAIAERSRRSRTVD